MHDDGQPQLRESFRRCFGSEPRIYRAPGRVNLIGEHTDYNDGFVLPAAIDLSAWVAAAPRTDRIVRVHAADLDRTVELALDDPVPRPAHDWSDYPRGVAAVLEGAGHRLQGADLLIASEVPIGAGLSSSAALEVAVAWALLDLAGIAIDPVAIAGLCQRAENDFVGARCGIMDQYAACCGREGHALFLDCRSLVLQRVAIPTEVAIVVCDSMVKHTLAAGEYNQRRAECEAALAILRDAIPEVRALRDVTMPDLVRQRAALPEPLYRRCRHVIGECARVLAAVAAIEQGDLAALGTLLYASHESLRDDYAVSCAELDLLVELAMTQGGVLGSRMMGGGFGGSTITLVARDATPDLITALGEHYERAYGNRPWVRVCCAANGAERIS